jgi:hypothetical protein
MLESPLPGEPQRITPAQAEAEGAAFMDLMAFEAARRAGT